MTQNIEYTANGPIGTKVNVNVRIDEAGKMWVSVRDSKGWQTVFQTNYCPFTATPAPTQTIATREGDGGVNWR